MFKEKFDNLTQQQLTDSQWEELDNLMDIAFQLDDPEELAVYPMSEIDNAVQTEGRTLEDILSDLAPNFDISEPFFHYTIYGISSLSVIDAYNLLHDNPEHI